MWWRKWDWFRDAPRDLTRSTRTTSVFSLVVVVSTTVLLCREFVSFCSIKINSLVLVDPVLDPDSLIPVNMNISFFEFPCRILSVDLEDVLGDHRMNIQGNLRKLAIDTNGILLDPNTKATVQGCRVEGDIRIKKVPGNLHVSFHAFFDQAFDLGLSKQANLSHTIHNLYFGSFLHIPISSELSINPLEAFSQVVSSDPNRDSLPSFEYYIKLVPSSFIDLRQKKTDFYQYTANHNVVVYENPSVYFRFDLTPTTIRFTETQAPFLHFLVQVSAILGGIVSCLRFASSIKTFYLI